MTEDVCSKVWKFSGIDLNDLEKMIFLGPADCIFSSSHQNQVPSHPAEIFSQYSDNTFSLQLLIKPLGCQC